MFKMLVDFFRMKMDVVFIVPTNQVAKLPSYLFSLSQWIPGKISPIFPSFCHNFAAQNWQFFEKFEMNFWSIRRINRTIDRRKSFDIVIKS